MDISKWPLNKIMQLPDHCFGRRFSIILGGRVDTGVTTFLLSELALPDVCVLHEISFHGSAEGLDRSIPSFQASIKLSDQVFVLAADVALLDDLLTGVDERMAGVAYVRSPLHLTRLRLPIFAQGRRVLARVHESLSVAGYFSLGLVFSSIPKEVPDCLVSA